MHGLTGNTGDWLRVLVLPGPCSQVAIRIRPLNSAELEEGATVIAHKVGDQVRLADTHSPTRGICWPGAALR